MRMKTKTVLLAMVGLLIFVFVSSAFSEISWSTSDKKSDSLRQLVGLPSFAVGNLNPSARNPGLEALCTSLIDSPGGYCYYFTPGVPEVNLKIYTNITEPTK
jgi:hypothetical protein